MDKQERRELRIKIDNLEVKFHIACRDLNTLDRRLQELRWRYINAKAKNLKTLRYTYRLRLAVIEAVRNMYHDYAASVAEELTQLKTIVGYSNSERSR